MFEFPKELSVQEMDDTQMKECSKEYLIQMIHRLRTEVSGLKDRLNKPNSMIILETQRQLENLREE